jgi:hypothetical protein
MAAVEFASFWKNVNQVELARIPNDCQHELVRLNCVSFSFGHFFTMWKPDQFVIRAQVEPQLVQGQDVMPRAIALDLEYSQ